MSAELYTVRVFFDGERGCVKVPGVDRRIIKPPDITGLPRLSGIDYAPAAQCLDITPYQDARREMWPQEVAALVAWLALVQRGLA